MSTLSVTTVQTANGTTDLSIKTGNTSHPGITILAATGVTTFGNSTFGNIPVYSFSNSAAAVYGNSNTSYGLIGLSNSLIGVAGQSVTNSAVYGVTNTGTGLYIQSNTGTIAQFVNATTTIATINASGLAITGNVTSTGNINAAAGYISTNTFNVGTNANTANGYTYLPNGFKLQWMTVSVTNAAAQALAWPVAFTGNPINVQGTISGTTVTAATILKTAVANATHITANSIGTNTTWYVMGIGI